MWNGLLGTSFLLNYAILVGVILLFMAVVFSLAIKYRELSKVAKAALILLALVLGIYLCFVFVLSAQLEHSHTEPNSISQPK